MKYARHALILVKENVCTSLKRSVLLFNGYEISNEYLSLNGMATCAGTSPIVQCFLISICYVQISSIVLHLLINYP